MTVHDATFQPSPTTALPTDTFETKSRKQIGDVHVAMQYYRPAHTDGDISVHFEEPDILHVGDAWFNGYYPFIDYSSGGSIDGMIRATQLNLKHVSINTIIIPGHGKIGGKDELQRSLDMLAGVREKVAAAKRQGKTLSEITALKPTAAYDTNFSAAAMTAEEFVSLVYAGV